MIKCILISEDYYEKASAKKPLASASNGEVAMSVVATGTPCSTAASSMSLSGSTPRQMIRQGIPLLINLS